MRENKRQYETSKVSYKGKGMSDTAGQEEVCAFLT